jgi:hypothetical protein
VTTGKNKVGKLIRQSLAQAVQGVGFSYREASRLVNTVLRLWIEALQRGEPVETPAGWLVVRKRKLHRVFRFDRVMDIPKQEQGVRLVSELSGEELRLERKEHESTRGKTSVR